MLKRYWMKRWLFTNQQRFAKHQRFGTITHIASVSLYREICKSYNRYETAQSVPLLCSSIFLHCWMNFSHKKKKKRFIHPLCFYTIKVNYSWIPAQHVLLKFTIHTHLKCMQIVLVFLEEVITLKWKWKVHPKCSLTTCMVTSVQIKFKYLYLVTLQYRSQFLMLTSCLLSWLFINTYEVQILHDLYWHS